MFVKELLTLDLDMKVFRYSIIINVNLIGYTVSSLHLFCNIVTCYSTILTYN